VEFTEWFDLGRKEGWISDAFCQTHDGGPMSDEEEQMFEDGEDPCIFTVRILEGSHDDGLTTFSE